jgi:putative transposase
VEINRKRIYRLYPVRAQAHAIDQTWSMDFVFDSLSNGRSIKCPTVIDDFSRESVQIAVDFGINAPYVTRLLDQAAQFRGYPNSIRTDNGPEFTSRAFAAWTQLHQIEHILIEPGAPTQNAYIESFNGSFRDECLNEHWFTTLMQARGEIALWRVDYNEVRPHSSCQRMPPTKFAAQHRKAIDQTMQTKNRSTQQNDIITNAAHH